MRALRCPSDLAVDAVACASFCVLVFVRANPGWQRQLLAVVQELGLEAHRLRICEDAKAQIVARLGGLA